ncbi:helix-turn-helix domain-containing protein [Cytobacillus massiliigabonensis]|uniref:helix-turn-helix domain-containing protein n=1 Tax=Cytobacillus massiliigabonensis TaxID=1871011 RepID=UPI001F32B84F|nr:helix-turn-helix domain-containing protein [Cytobacillus massiliigabonensis]
MMKNFYLSMIVLFCLHKINGERTIYSILHLLNGKKSSQTIQDAHFFRLTSFFSIYPSIKRVELERIIDFLQKQRFISKNTEQSYCVTSFGIKQLEEYFKQNPIPVYLNGWKYHNLTELFWERLSLAVQVISQLKNRNSKYLPIQKNKELHHWLKEYLFKSKLSKDEIAEKLYDELVACLETIDGIDPSILVRRLTGFSLIGLTENQAADLFDLDEGAYHIQFLSILHYMLEKVGTKQSDFPLLSFMIEDKKRNVPLTESSNRTFNLLQTGYNLDQIAHMRNLKKNTIEDHLVEIALNIPDFDVTPFVDIEKQKKIIAAINSVSSKQLKHIRVLVPDADYFEIRLVLAKGGERK